MKGYTFFYRSRILWYTKTAKQLHWIRNLYKELGFKLGPLPLCVNNQGAIFLASNPAQEGRTKHVRMTEHFI